MLSPIHKHHAGTHKGRLALISVSQSNLMLQFKFRSWGFWFWE